MPVTLIWGDDDYLIEKEADKIKASVIGVEASELNYKTSDNPDFQTFVSLLRMQPMMFGEVVVKIKAEKYFLETGKKVKLDDKMTSELVGALDLISDKVHIVLTCLTPKREDKKPDSRRKFFKAIQSKGKIIECKAFKPWEEYKMVPIIKEMMRELKLKPENNVAEEIAKRSGPYLRDIAVTVDKLSLYAYPENVVKIEMLDNVQPLSQNIFALVDLILASDYSKTMTEISNMLQKAHYLEILSFLQGGFSKTLNTKIYSKTMSSFDIARKTGQNEYAVKMTLNKLKNVDLSRLIKLKQKLLAAEYEIKTGEKEPLTSLLEAFVK